MKKNVFGIFLLLSGLGYSAQSAAYDVTCEFTKLPAFQIAQDSTSGVSHLTFSVSQTSPNWTCVNGSPWVWVSASDFYLGNLQRPNSFNGKLYDMLMTSRLLNLPVRITARMEEHLEVSGYVGDSVIHSIQYLK